MYSEPATRSVVAAHYTRIQLRPGIFSIGGFKAMQLGRNKLVFKAYFSYYILCVIGFQNNLEGLVIVKIHETMPVFLCTS